MQKKKKNWNNARNTMCFQSTELDNLGSIGKTIVMPSSFIGGPRDMHQRYMDVMALIQKFEKPDFLLLYYHEL